MKKIIVGLSSLFFLAACNNNQPVDEKPSKTPIDSLMDLVMHGHDEGMGRVGRVEKAAQELSHKIDSIKQAKKIDQQLLASWQNAKRDLDAADSSMNKWMNTFDMDMEGMDSIAKIKYLQLNEKWVSGVADSLKTALNTADSLLKK
ncbi:MULTISPECIES: lipoprotein [Chitinophagaceae]